MCRLSIELAGAAGGIGIITTIITFAKTHFDVIKDRKAFKAAKELEKTREETNQ